MDDEVLVDVMMGDLRDDEAVGSAAQSQRGAIVTVVDAMMTTMMDEKGGENKAGMLQRGHGGRL
jgi:hypothetical protein